MLEFLIGLGLGLGHATKLRFLGKVGPSEILLLLAVILLLKKYYREVFSFSYDMKGFIKFYIFLTIFIVAPIMTIITKTLTDYKESTPIYFLSFTLEYIFMFSLVMAYNENIINFRKIVYIYATIFVGINLFLYFFPVIDVYYGGIRFEGLAKNPNQLGFYAISLILAVLIAIDGLKKYILIALTMFIIFVTYSDAAMLAIVVSLVIYFIFKITSFVKVKYTTKLFLIVVLIISFSSYIWLSYKDYLVLLWYQADEGSYQTGGRLALWINAIKVIITYPLFGLGFGNFTGYNSPFQGCEAHNTILDLGMQFGISFPLLLYILWLYTVIDFFKRKQYLLSSFLIGYLILGLFHYYARHFNFWFELSLLYYYIFFKDNLNHIQQLNHIKKKVSRICAV